MFCNHCGKTVEGDSAFCGYCGGEVGQAQAVKMKSAKKKSKKSLIVMLAALMAIAVIGGGFYIVRGLFGPSVGDIIEFGGYDWRVLDIQDGKALILSNNVLEIRAYHDVYKTGITWEHSDIRRYLNGDFYDSFSVNDRQKIAETQVKNNDNQWYGTSGGRDTTDRIFLLSIEEVVKYFGDSGELAVRPRDNDRDWTGDGYADYIVDQYNFARSATYETGTSSWWLRTPGGFSGGAALVLIGGYLSVSGDGVSNVYVGVRPALWLKL